MPLVGPVSFENSTLLCPPASLFIDAFGGLYGPGAFQSTFTAAPWGGVNLNDIFLEPCQYLTSTLQFGCTPCPTGTYSLISGHSDGTPSGHISRGNSGGVVNPVCAPCPFGGACTSHGAVVSQPGYWGAASSDGSVSFAVCPPGYCCPDGQTCAAIDSCDGDRAGPLCGDCGPGLVQSILSPVCVPREKCGEQMKLFWVCAVVGVFCMATIQLLFVSNLMPHVNHKIRFGAKFVLISLSTRLLPGRLSLASARVLHAGAGRKTGKSGPTSAVVKVLMYFSQV